MFRWNLKLICKCRWNVFFGNVMCFFIVGPFSNLTNCVFFLLAVLSAGDSQFLRYSKGFHNLLAEPQHKDQVCGVFVAAVGV